MRRLRLLALIASALSLCSSSSAHAQVVDFGAIDEATFRVFAVGEVGSEEVDAGGRRFTVASPSAGHGTGFGVAEHLVLTAAHVVNGASYVVVRLPGHGAQMPATVIHRDDENDIAVLYVPEAVPTLTLAPRGTSLRVRQTTFALGYPLDGTRTRPQSSRGIVSGVVGTGHLQLDIGLNPGQSGGPLVDEADRVVGMVVARLDPSAGAVNVGLATSLPALHDAVARARLELREHPDAHRISDAQRACSATIDTLMNIGMLAVVRDAATHDHEDPEPSEMMRRLLDMRETTSHPDARVLLAAFLWNSAMTLRIAPLSARMPLAQWGPQNQLAGRTAALAARVLEQAIAEDPTVRERSAFVAALMARGLVHDPDVAPAPAMPTAERQGPTAPEADETRRPDETPALRGTVRTDERPDRGRVGFAASVGLSALYGPRLAYRRDITNRTIVIPGRFSGDDDRVFMRNPDQDVGYGAAAPELSIGIDAFVGATGLTFSLGYSYLRAHSEDGDIDEIWIGHVGYVHLQTRWEVLALGTGSMDLGLGVRAGAVWMRHLDDYFSEGDLVDAEGTGRKTQGGVDLSLGAGAHAQVIFSVYVGAPTFTTGVAYAIRLNQPHRKRHAD